jgi:hypothetical protein
MGGIFLEKLTASEEFPEIFLNSKCYYSIHKTGLLVHIPSHINPLNNNPAFNIIFPLRLALSSGLFPYGFPTKILHALHFLAMHAICPAHLILLDLRL